jgi:uncharacterized metal-binding protein YceD (DUF177 family)
MTPEFSREFPLDGIGAVPRLVSVEANQAECAALAVRFGLVSIESLSASAHLSSSTRGYVATGTLSAAVTQSCIASAAPVAAKIKEPFTIRFSAPDEVGEGDEIELDADDCDMMEHDGRALDLGEAAAQTLALALDPFPRAKGADAILRAAGVIAEDAAVTGPFAGLKDLVGKG